jgi:hypothetical protein
LLLIVFLFVEVEKMFFFDLSVEKTFTIIPLFSL